MERHQCVPLEIGSRAAVGAPLLVVAVERGPHTPVVDDTHVQQSDFEVESEMDLEKKLPTADRSDSSRYMLYVAW